MSTKSCLCCMAISLMLSVTSLSSAQGREAGAVQPRSPSSEAAPENSTYITDNFNSASATDVDVFQIGCAGKTTICADVGDIGPFFDNSFYVQTTCIKPGNVLGRTDKAIAPKGGISSSACVLNCKEALITYSCQDNTFCDDTYDSIVFCGGTTAIKTNKTGYVQDQ